MFLSVLSKKRTDLLKKIEFLEKYGFYLAGGTALALQIRHRTSLDFDFYTKKDFETQKIKEEFETRCKSVQEIYVAENTLSLNVDEIGVSLFKYSYALIKPLQKVEKVYVASLEDIAAMKIIAISQRGKKRDFIDIYFLIKNFGLQEIIKFTKEKYPMFNIYVGLQGLVYFKDADEDIEEKRFRLLEKADWKDVKNYIIKEVNNVRRLL